MNRWIKVANVNQLAPGQGILVRARQHKIALFNVEGAFYAIDNSCPHSTGPLSEGRLSGTIVTCPWHGAQFDITNGRCCAGPAVTDVVAYPIQVEDQAIFIEITER